MSIRPLAAFVALLSLVWAGIGLWIVWLAAQPGGEPEDAVVLFAPILVLSLVGCLLSTRTLRRRNGAMPLSVFAGTVAASFGLYVALAPFAHYGSWATSDTVAWLLAIINVALLAGTSWRLSWLAQAATRSA